MRVPFFKSRPRDGVIDVATRPVKGTPAVPKTVVASVLPDLGDYTAEYPETPPESARILPFFTWSLIVGCVAWGIWGNVEQSNLRADRQAAAKKLSAAQAAQHQVEDRRRSIADKETDLAILQRWASLSFPMRGVMVTAAKAAANRVQIRSMDLRRKEPNTLRYSLQMICTGTSANFKAVRETLVDALKLQGWTVEEVQAAPDDDRLIFEATLTRPALGATAET